MRVCESSGTSRGSLLHQFPTRADLMAAAVAHLFESLSRDFLEAFAELRADATGTDAGRVQVAGELLRAGYANPRLPAVLDIFAAARTDAELMAALEPVAAKNRRIVIDTMHELFPETVVSARANRRFLLALDALQGLAFRSVVQGDEGAVEVLQGMKELLVEAVGEARDEAS